MNLNFLLYFFAFLAICGAIGVVFFRDFLYATLSLLTALLSVCGILHLLKAGIISTVLFWHLGVTSVFVLLHTFFLLGPQNSHKSPRRLVPGKFFFVFIVLYIAVLLYNFLPIFHVFPLSGIPIKLQDLSILFQTKYAFAIFLLLSLSPFIFISSLLLIRQDKSADKE